jgi:hypothetical protein
VALPILATIWFVAGLTMVLLFARDTLGYDYQAYVGAARRLLDGLPLYDTAVDVAGPFAIFLYPPPFAVAFIPFALLPASAGVWVWTLLSIAMVAAAIAILPVRRDVRWTVLLLAGIDWPVVYAVKLGQVGPLLLLVFALGWRWLDRPAVVAASITAGTLIKLQPALLFVWAALTRQTRVLTYGLGMLVAVVLVTLPIVGVPAWSDYVTVIRAVSDPIATPNNYTAGAIAYRSGASEGLATAIQLASMVIALGLWVAICRRGTLAASFVATIVASQLLSPLLWDHYAMLLLLPVALLLERRWWWAVLIPLSTNSFTLGVLGPVYPWVVVAGFFACLVALLFVPARDGEPA